MILKKVKKQRADRIAERISKDLIKQPLFMYLCPNSDARAGFIKNYLKYYILKWSKEDILFCDLSNHILISIEDPSGFKYRFKGPHAVRMKLYKNSSSVFVHKENIETVMEILIPEGIPARVMTIYANPEMDPESLNQLLEEVKTYADQENIVLAYETFSQKFVPYMSTHGFENAYTRQFFNTQFVETIMIYNFEKEQPTDKKLDITL